MRIPLLENGQPLTHQRWHQNDRNRWREINEMVVRFPVAVGEGVPYWR